MVVYKSLDRKVQLGNPKSGHGRLRELKITAQELVAYESGCKESFDCI